MEDIKIAITNGNWTDAVRLIKNSNYTWLQIIGNLMEDELYKDDVLPLLNVMETLGYLQVHKDYED